MRHYTDMGRRASCDDGRVHTAEVGSYGSNGHGLHDILGNVWEWMEDCWHGDYKEAPSDGSAWTRGGDCEKRVMRGGSWRNAPKLLRSAFRYGYPSGSRIVSLGFRVARTLTP